MAQEFDPAGHSPDRPHDDAVELYGDAAPPPVAATPAHHSPPPTSGPPDPTPHSPFPIVMSVVMAGTLVGAWFISRQQQETAAAGAPATAAAPAADAKPAAEEKKPEATAAAPADDAKALKGDVDALAKRLDDLQAKLDSMPKPEPAADFKALQEKVDQVAKVPDAIAPLPKKLDDLDGRIGSIGKELDGLKADVASLKKGPDATATAAPAPAPAPADVNVSDQAMGQAVDLFKNRKYKEAADAFRKLSEDEKNDARVWYYAALSNGLATGKWTGDTETYVKKGVEREKAGTPAPGKIDEVLADVPSSIKPWLAGWRKYAAK